MKRNLGKWLVVGLILAVILVVGIIFSIPDNKLHLVVCDVGQGDAILLTVGTRQVLIDGGPNSKVIGCLSKNMPFWDRSIEMVVLTHAQSDHMAGLLEVLDRYDVERLILNGVVNESEEFWEFRRKVVAEGALVHLPKQGDRMVLRSLELEVLWPETRLGSELVWVEENESKILGVESYNGEINETSVALKLSFGEFDAMLVGDLGLEVEQALVGSGVLKNVEFLKVGHHGSKYATSSEFLSEIGPELAVISVGKDNFYGHPTSESLIRLDRVGAKVYRTDVDGDVEVVSDGRKYWVVE